MSLRLDFQNHSFTAIFPIRPSNQNIIQRGFTTKNYFAQKLCEIVWRLENIKRYVSYLFFSHISVTAKEENLDTNIKKSPINFWEDFLLWTYFYALSWIYLSIKSRYLELKLSQQDAK